MAEQVIRNPRGKGVISVTGGEAGKGAKYDAIAEKEERQKYRARHGASGLGGARKASETAFQAKENAHIKAWKKARSAAAGKKKAQRRAATSLPKPKPSPSPSPSPKP